MGDPKDKSRFLTDAAAATSLEEQARRDNIRITLIQHAQTDFLKLLPAAEGGYSRELAALQRRMDAYLKATDHSIHNKVEIFDPNKFDAGRALGLSPDVVAALMMTAQHDQVNTEHDKKVAQELGGLKYRSRFGVDIDAQEPRALMNLKGDQDGVCLVSPSSEYAPEFNVPGLSRADSVLLANRHETWHCLDNKYTLSQLDQDEMKKIDFRHIGNYVGNKTAMEAFSINARKETVADVGAVGDLIREGKGLDFLDKVADWRKSFGKGDMEHVSTPVLEALKHKIEEMGIGKFRKLKDADAKKLYYDLTEEYGMTANRLETGLKIVQSGEADKLGYMVKAKTDPEVEKAINIWKYVGKPSHEPDKPLSPAEQEIAKKLKDWDAGAALQDKAFAQSHKITPATLIKAYGKLRDELSTEAKKHPDDPLVALKMAKLQQAFVNDVQSIDYVAVNAKHGVKIEDVEPALRSPSKPAHHAKANAAPA